MKGLDHFFTPRSVAIIGASHTPAKLGYTILENLDAFDLGYRYVQKLGGAE
ncbi:MAG: hypothetical protein QMD36_05935 [Candidatus Aenigmarchaeota archaeon]|nr:hypothetical protein [Candidatus Aenigmarchaeota archaeon]